MLTDDPSLQLGKRLKTLRKARGLTLRELADVSGLSMNTISLIERRKISPTVATLSKLAGALGIMTADFLVEESGEQVIFLKQDQRQRVRSMKTLIENLGTGLSNRMMEPLLITLEPEANSGVEPLVHLGQELVFCLEGQVVYEIGSREYVLASRDSLLFEAHQPHRWHNKQTKISQILLIIQLSEESQKVTH